MSTFRLLCASLFHYWRTNVAVMLGVAAATAVIAGALIVGDSVRGSLETMSRERLGDVDFALSGHRFIREAVAEELSEGDETKPVAPAIAMQGALERRLYKDEEKAEYARAGQVNVYGLDERLWNLLNHAEFERPTGNEVTLSERLAGQLAETTGEGDEPLKPGDAVTLWIELPATIPRDSLLGDREQKPSVSVPLVVKDILPEQSGVGRFALTPSQQLPLNAFVDLKGLQEVLGIEAKEIRNPIARRIDKIPARVNALLSAAPVAGTGDTAAAVETADALTRKLHSALSSEDLQIRFREQERYVSLETEQQILPSPFADAGRAAADELKANTSPVMVYIANEMANADRSQVVLIDENESEGQGYSMYSVVAGVKLPQDAGFGDFTYIGGAPEFPLGDDGVVLNKKLAKQLGVGVGEKITLTYYVVGAHVLGAEGKIPEESITLVVRGIVKMEGPADDRGWVPELKGVTDAKTFAQIKEPFPMKRNLITEHDDQYWAKHGPTPKAFLDLEVAQSLWKSRYGQLTSLRIATRDGETTVEKIAEATLKDLEPESIGLAFRPVKFQGLAAAQGTTDFSGLFFGFSFFLILSAMILVGLLFRLGIERRVRNIGLLSAVGNTPAQVRRLFLWEGGVLVVVGGLLGLALAVGYASLMVYGLKTWWIGAIGTRFLEVFLLPMSLLTGFAIAVVIALGTVWWALRQLKQFSTRELLSGATERALSATAQHERRKRASTVAWICCGITNLLVVLSVVGVIPNSEAFMGLSWQVVAFFIVGLATLTGLLAGFLWTLDASKDYAVKGHGFTGDRRLGKRNASRSRLRSMLTVGLIASATFVIVAVAAGHRNPAVETPVKDSGNGGFLLVAESSTPITYDLNTLAGRNAAGLTESAGERAALLDNAGIMPFRVKPGENASCLNLYQTQLPTVLGVPERMIERGGFKFVGADRENPWTLLTESQDDATITAEDGETQHTVPAYPVFGDMNTLMYSLHKAVGDVIPVPDADNPEYALKIVGMFDGSVFQGVLLTSETNFDTLYPEQDGYAYFLVEAAPAVSVELSNVLESGLHDYGFDAEPVGDRLRTFLEVQNTYLSTFQALGGLGLLLGTLGLGTVMLRNVVERRSEIALLRAVGFRPSRVGGVVLFENAFLLLWGLAAGTISALIAMMPHLQSTGADVPWTGLLATLAGVFLIGTLAALLAVREAVHTPILATLRSE